MFTNMNPHLERHHEIAFGVLKQLSLTTTHIASWAEAAVLLDQAGNYESPWDGEEGEACLSSFVDALRRALVLEAESGNLPADESELAKREALYIALHAYFDVQILPFNLD